MIRGALKTLTAGSVSVLAFAASTTFAQALPDLVIEASDSNLNFVSCDESQPLVSGRIVIRNEGSTDANLRSAKDILRSFLAVYVPENIDLIKKATERSKMEPREQRSISISIGRGDVKRGRNYSAYGAGGGSSSGGYPTEDGWLKMQDKYEDAIKSVQAFLQGRGYSVGSGEPDGDFGSGSRRSLKSFQRNSGLDATGEWNSETAEKIAELAGGSSAGAPAFENIKNENGETEITVFAVVDPYNLIKESNENNNIVVYRGYLECDAK